MGRNLGHCCFTRSNSKSGGKRSVSPNSRMCASAQLRLTSEMYLSDIPGALLSKDQSRASRRPDSAVKRLPGLRFFWNAEDPLSAINLRELSSSVRIGHSENGAMATREKRVPATHRVPVDKSPSHPQTFSPEICVDNLTGDIPNETDSSPTLGRSAVFTPDPSK
jgi:hypothetical protein